MCIALSKIKNIQSVSRITDRDAGKQSALVSKQPENHFFPAKS
jgi:hypothetical protein